MNLIQQPPFMLRWAYPGAVWRLSKTEKTVYLTFDDGPIPEVTPWVLSVLKEFEIRATFFCVGQNVENYPEIFQEIIRSGHAVGNHTFLHVRGRKSSLDDYLSDVNNAQKFIQSNLFRPPYGSLSIQQFAALRKKFKIVFWDVLTEDYSPKINSEECLNNVKRFTRNGSVIVFHDSLKAAERLFEFLPAAIQYLKEQGYGFDVIR